MAGPTLPPHPRLILFIALLLSLLPCIHLLCTYAYFLSIIHETIAPSPPSSPPNHHKYTAVIISHPRRLSTLRTVIAHYSRYPSLHEIVVV